MTDETLRDECVKPHEQVEIVGHCACNPPFVYWEESPSPDTGKPGWVEGVGDRTGLWDYRCPTCKRCGYHLGDDGVARRHQLKQEVDAG